jgi:lipopolysaccharide/colanic/teichoic acid biosynthesis glycosyltransferase
MCVDAEARLNEILAENPEANREWRSGFKLKSDPRVVPYIGRFARRLSLDELPQLINVVRGEMALVGPRPFPPNHLAVFPPDFAERRASVMPGVTGLWQIERTGNDINEQQALDDRYLENRCLRYDLLILIRTCRAVMFGKGAF